MLSTIPLDLVEPMTQPAPEDPLAALREEIARCGTVSGLLKLGATAAAVIVGCFWGYSEYAASQARWVPWSGGTCCFGPCPPGMWLRGGNPFEGLVVNYQAVVLGVMLLLAAVFAAIWQVYPRLRRGELLARLGALAVDDRAAVLASLRDQDAHTRRIAASLLRNLSLPTELTPAGTPEGSGAEVSGVKHGGFETLS